MNPTPLSPFGLLITTQQPGCPLQDLPSTLVHPWVAAHRLIVLRGFAPPTDEVMLEFCRQLGPLLEWEFGAVNELQVRPEARNYLYTPSEVPMHWDGAFAGRIPHYIFFHCQQAPPAEAGGETVFCDTVRLLELAGPARRELWERVRITYSTEKLAHYGGSFTSALIGTHPLSKETVLRFAEPVRDRNPVHLQIDGIAADQHDRFLEEMHERLNAPEVCLAHRWQQNDIVIADNHALLHGRRAFAIDAPRHLRRVNIL